MNCTAQWSICEIKTQCESVTNKYGTLCPVSFASKNSFIIASAHLQCPVGLCLREHDKSLDYSDGVGHKSSARMSLVDAARWNSSQQMLMMPG